MAVPDAPIVAPGRWTPEQVLALAAGAAAILVALFALLALLRYWAHRMGARTPAGRGLDLETLRRQRQGGEISQDEYEAIRGQMAGLPPQPRPRERKTPDAGQPGPPGRPIDSTEATGGDAQRSPDDGQK